MPKLTVTWSTSRQGNQGIIEEHHSTGDTFRFIVPSHLVPAALEARRRIVHRAVAALGGNPDLEEDFSWMGEGEKTHTKN